MEQIGYDPYKEEDEDGAQDQINDMRFQIQVNEEDQSSEYKEEEKDRQAQPDSEDMEEEQEQAGVEAGYLLTWNQIKCGKEQQRKFNQSIKQKAFSAQPSSSNLGMLNPPEFLQRPISMMVDSRSQSFPPIQPQKIFHIIKTRKRRHGDLGTDTHIQQLDGYASVKIPSMNVYAPFLGGGHLHS